MTFEKMIPPPLPKRVNNEQFLLFFYGIKRVKRSRCTTIITVGNPYNFTKLTPFSLKKSRKRVGELVTDHHKNKFIKDCN